MQNKKILIFGVSGMLGHVLFNRISKNHNFEVFGTTRTTSRLSGFFSVDELARIRNGVDADNFDTVVRAVASVQPDIIVNCIGLIKQIPIATDPLTAVTVNAQLPHRMSLIARTAKARLIHISTDCVFDGTKGNYTEQDPSDAKDLYGRTKFLGEVEYPHCVTLRTSIIGHELQSQYGLIEWFLNQTGSVQGFTKAIYTGFSTIELAKIIIDYVIPNEKLRGLYHVSSSQISKFDLLNIVKVVYEKKIVIEAFDGLAIDRSLNSERFQEITGYRPPTWAAMVRDMHADFMEKR